MKICLDFVKWLGPVASSSVLILIDDPADLVRVSAVSRSWRRLVIASGFCKGLCIRMYPELSNLTRVVETRSVLTSEAGSSYCAEWKNLEREHRVYSYLSHSIVSADVKRSCIYDAIHASSTDIYPHESIEHTILDLTESYWSSEGQKDPEVPETLTYMLLFKLCVINEIIIQPYEAYFEPGNPIYSARTVRFRMGHSRLPLEICIGKDGQPSAVDNFEWTYTSPEFVMFQENALQTFVLPRPALCVGGILRIELFGRVQAQEIDGLYYLRLRYVEALGHILAPLFDVGFIEAGREMVLKWQPEASDSCLGPSEFIAFGEKLGRLREEQYPPWQTPPRRSSSDGEQSPPRRSDSNDEQSSPRRSDSNDEQTPPWQSDSDDEQYLQWLSDSDDEQSVQRRSSSDGEQSPPP